MTNQLRPSQRPTAPPDTPAGQRIAALVSGYLTEERRLAIQRGERPRIDVLELEAQHGAQIYDFLWLEARIKAERLTGWLAALLLRRIGWSAFLVLRFLLELRRFDVVYTTGEELGLPLAALLRLAGRRRPRVLLRLEQMAFGRTRLRRKLYGAYFRFAMPRVDLTVCRAASHAALLRRALKLPASALHVNPEPVDPRFFAPAAPRRPDAVTVPDEPYIVSAGLEMRDYATLLEAARGLPVKVVIGAGSPWSKFSFDQGVDVPENVIVSSFDPVQMRELYRSARLAVVAVRPSRRTCGISVILEAWSMGLPVVATRTIGLRHYIRDGENALFAPPRDSAALRAAILRLLAEPELAAQLGRSGRQDVERINDVDGYVARLAEQIGRLGGATPRASAGGSESQSVLSR
jgi:glycosyltransferase involved in cell wall biosynthesis